MPYITCGGILNRQQLTLQDPETVTVAIERFRAAPKIGFSDCLVLEVALKAGHRPLGTFDSQLGKSEGAQRQS
jgi:predicted nucleic-acid-binding protein